MYIEMWKILIFMAIVVIVCVLSGYLASYFIGKLDK